MQSLDLRFFSSHFVRFSTLKEQTFLLISPLLKQKVTLVAIAILSSFTFISLIYRWYQSRKISLKNPTSTEEERIKNIITILNKNIDHASKQQEKQKPSRIFNIKDNPLNEILVGEIDEDPSTRTITANTQVINHQEVGMSYCIEKANQEMLAIHETFQSNRMNYEFDLFGIVNQNPAFDANKIAKCFKIALEKTASPNLSGEKIFDAFEVCFKMLNEHYQGAKEANATIAVIINETIWVAHVGNFRAILIKEDGSITQATEDSQQTHQSLSVEDSLIVDESSNVVFQPKITCFAFEDFQKGYLVLACQGLYKAASTEQVGTEVKKMADKNLALERISKSLVYSAIDTELTNEATTMVVRL